MENENEPEDEENGPCCHCGSHLGKMTFIEHYGEWVCDDSDCYEQPNIWSHLFNQNLRWNKLSPLAVRTLRSLLTNELHPEWNASFPGHVQVSAEELHFPFADVWVDEVREEIRAFFGITSE